MKICITAQGTTLDSQVDPRFGRCAYFILIETDTREFEAIANANVNLRGGAGIQSGQLISEKNVKAVLTGSVGPNAFQVLQAGGVEVITGATGTVQEALETYIKGDFKPTNKANVDSHSGLKGGT
jgi:predicted Fe-Mo cluster-binding NifX family protein